MMFRLIILITSLYLSACTNLITAQRYENQGINSMNKGDYDNAAEMFRRAVINAELSHLDKAAVGHYSRQYAMALGKNCQSSDAEDVFKKTILLFDDNFGIDSGRSVQTRLEYFTFLSDMGRYEEAANQISPILPMIEKKVSEQNSDDLNENYHKLLNHYAFALHESGNINATTDVMKKINEVDPTENIESVVNSVQTKSEEKKSYPSDCPLKVD